MTLVKIVSECKECEPGNNVLPMAASSDDNTIRWKRKKGKE